MYLKALEIQGFKSFPDKTRLTFEKDITAIVGPNGSGKSNISDAILWVMGEQSSKTLRGSKMEDVIFGGTAVRNPMGFAEVSLIIDNSARIFDSDYSEIELTRRYYRSGESEYYINREAVRLKDINSLLMDTGLGRDGYSIIGQGKIADIVSTKSQDRREVFEEAAGISRFRYRKEEAERRLEKTDDNLLRINDKIEELELQVGPLKEQSETAKKYLVLRDELRVKEVSSWMETLDKLHERAGAVQQEYDQAYSELEQAKTKLESLYVASDSLSERMHLKDSESEEARDSLSAKMDQAAECSSAIDVLRANLQANDESMNRMLGDISEQEERINDIRNGIDESEKRIAEIEDEAAALTEKIDENNNVIAGCKLLLSSRESAYQKATDNINNLIVETGAMEHRIRLLSDMKKDYEGYSKSVRTVMRESEHGAIKGVHGPVAELVKTDEECALAIETALGAAGQNIIIDSREDGRKAIEYLKRIEGGRATFLPLDTIKGELLKDNLENEIGFVGIAYNLVSFDEKYDQIIASILGKTVVVESLQDAVRLSRQHNDRYKIVTLDGQMIHVGGSMTGGSKAQGAGIISRANELDSLRKEYRTLMTQLDTAKKTVEKAKSDVDACRYDLDVAQEDRNGFSAKKSSLDTEKHAVRSTISQFKILLDSLAEDSDVRKDAIERFRIQKEDLLRKIDAKQAELDAVNETIESIRTNISELSAYRLDLESKRTRNEKEVKGLNEEIIDLERRVARIEGRKTSAELEEKQIIDKLWDNYELSFTAAQNLRQPVDNLNRLNKEIAEIKNQISSLGTPNIGAIEEYSRVSERYEFLSSQRDDVEKAKSELLTIISDVTKEMKTLFLERFRMIDAEFRHTFLELFGGGKASLELEDESDVLGCGIDIKVQPPGKSLNSISLLSGGEMAFVAIALYFAILKVRPTPFCVMDEIEAALDEANVNRFADYLRNMSDRTQFLVITHRRGTMENADMLYGVTMQEKGVSSILELDLDQAKKSAES